MNTPPLALTSAIFAGFLLPQVAPVGPQGGSTAPAATPVVDDAQEAQALLEKAEEQARKGRYKDARRTYAKIVDKFAGTPAAEVAARRSGPSGFVGWDWLVQNGQSANRVDIVIFGEAFELKHQKGFDKTAATVPRLFERQSVYEEYLSYFNFIRGNLVSADGHVDGFGREYDTALGGRTGKTFAGHVRVDNALVYGMLDELPEHDMLAIVITRDGVFGTGGHGVATIALAGLAEIAIHEFGHAFVGLGDEYATQTHERGEAHDGINVAASEDPNQCPWKHWLDAKVPGIGLYEGANGQVRGAWKPTSTGCVMGSGEFFCKVCREATVLRIYSLVDPIDRCDPQPHLADSGGSIEVVKDVQFEVLTLVPASHAIEVSWWVVPEAKAPRYSPGGGSDRYGNGNFEDRRARGPLPTLHAKPEHTTKAKNGVHRFKVRRSDLVPGRYRVIARAKDTTKLRGEKWPWVLKDELGVLQSERAWWVEVKP
ncbi:MAG: hypothetical protein GY711_16710 [bacterium]|nr:hypothetical protein [bacterium]